MADDFLLSVAAATIGCVIGGIILSILTYSLSRISRIKWISSSDSGRNRIKFLKTIHTQVRQIYPSPDHWNYKNSFKNHFIYSFIGSILRPEQYKNMEVQLGIFQRYRWFRSVDNYMKHRNNLDEINTRLNEVLDERVMFKIIRTKNHDIIEPIKPFINTKAVERFTSEANKALKYYSKILKIKI